MFFLQYRLFSFHYLSISLHDLSTDALYVKQKYDRYMDLTTWFSGL